ncbi:hypothetical protein DWH07_25065 [Escherichia coli]|nr:hypothetical protein [Escherichia coli]
MIADMIFRQVYGSVLFLHIYMVGKDWLFLHGNLQILLLHKKNVGLLLHQLRHEEIFLSGILKMLFLSFRPWLMMKGLIPH